MKWSQRNTFFSSFLVKEMYNILICWNKYLNDAWVLYYCIVVSAHIMFLPLRTHSGDVLQFIVSFTPQHSETLTNTWSTWSDFYHWSLSSTQCHSLAQTSLEHWSLENHSEYQDLIKMICSGIRGRGEAATEFLSLSFIFTMMREPWWSNISPSKRYNIFCCNKVWT